MIGLVIGPSSQCWQPMLAIDIGPIIIDRGLHDNCWPIPYWLVILVPKSFSNIGRGLLPELSQRPFKFVMILIITIKFLTYRIVNTTNYILTNPALVFF